MKLHAVASKVYMYYSSVGHLFGGNELGMMACCRYQLAGVREVFLIRIQDVSSSAPSLWSRGRRRRPPPPPLTSEDWINFHSKYKDGGSDEPTFPKLLNMWKAMTDMDRCALECPVYHCVHKPGTVGRLRDDEGGVVDRSAPPLPISCSPFQSTPSYVHPFGVWPLPPLSIMTNDPSSFSLSLPPRCSLLPTPSSLKVETLLIGGILKTSRVQSSRGHL